MEKGNEESIQFRNEFSSGIETFKDVSKEQESQNARLLIKAGFINPELAGVYTYTRLGYEVLKNIEDLTREHMSKWGGEILMPSLQPVENWETTNRLEKMSSLFEVRGANEISRKLNSSRYILGPTHEEIVTPLAKRYIKSYRDLPLVLYQIQTKFRNEARPKSGLLRSREFRMKDLYSFHENEENLLEFYEIMKREYMLLFEDLGLAEDTFLTLAEGGDFTKEFSHEFQTLIPQGEDTIYLDRENRIAYNKEIVNRENEERLGVQFDEFEQVSASEVGNIFPLNLKFSDPFGLTYTTKEGTVKPVYMGCYGLGTSRLMGVIAEKFADEKGLVWPEKISPAKFHIVTMSKDREGEVYKLSKKLFDLVGKDALWDRRTNVSVGEKLKDADLIGCPYRIVISPKSIERGGVEVKARTLEKEEYISIEQLINKYGGIRKE
ncbi:MAG TPA: prolyl-tRNA synthetase [Candidatus Methanofastidiosum sp.]|nr:prolyl-tRNA synthetase [Methanofastidiosum sp.]